MTTDPAAAAVAAVTSTAPTPYLDLVAATRPARQYKHELLSALCIGAGDRVLDVGCGPATDLAALAEEVGPTGRVIGIDQDPAMVATARARIAVYPNVEVHHADAHHLPLETAGIDRARVDRVLMHTVDPAAVLTDFDTAETILGLRRNTDRAVAAGYLTPEAGRAWLDHLTGTETFFATTSLMAVLAAA